MSRGDEYQANAEAAQATALKATDPDIRRQLLDVAAQWRDLARQADEYDKAVREFTTAANNAGSSR